MIFSFCFISFLLLSNMTFLNISLSFHSSVVDSFQNFYVSLNFSDLSLLFIFMFLMVSSLISLYSQIYMEHYNNNKFVALMLLFMLSMLTLTLSQSYMMLMVGWDALGLSSIALIMFYPNKTTQYNSFLTMMFNRIGDVVLISIFSLSILKHHYSLGLNFDSFAFFLLLVLCSFTKSAQFPLSAWLPAAMSAPTPISAMVHSSTLVTAGIFIVSKFFWHIEFWMISSAVCFFSLLTFVLGGFMANLEKDFKKIIAFSTMSQISMIMFFLSLGFLSIFMAHMVYHALFKTLLFCCSGLLFIINFSDQRSSIFSLSYKDLMYQFFFYISVFSMTGLMFSSSFFSKDLAIEMFTYESQMFALVILLSGSCLTLLYCSHLSSVLFSWCSSVSYFYQKGKNFMFLTFFVGLTLWAGVWSKSIILLDYCPLVSWSEIMTVIVLLLAPLILFNKLMISVKYFYQFCLSVGYSKFFSYSQWSKFFDSFLKVVSFSDTMYIKAKLFQINLENKSIKNYKYLIYCLILLCLLYKNL